MPKAVITNDWEISRGLLLTRLSLENRIQIPPEHPDPNQKRWPALCWIAHVFFVSRYFSVAQLDQREAYTVASRTLEKTQKVSALLSFGFFEGEQRGY